MISALWLFLIIPVTGFMGFVFGGMLAGSKARETCANYISRKSD